MIVVSFPFRMRLFYLTRDYLFLHLILMYLSQHDLSTDLASTTFQHIPLAPVFLFSLVSFLPVKSTQFGESHRLGFSFYHFLSNMNFHFLSYKIGLIPPTIQEAVRKK
jgi:hypothetical protein